MWFSSRAFQRVFGCKNRLRYRRERAPQSSDYRSHFRSHAEDRSERDDRPPTAKDCLQQKQLLLAHSKILPLTPLGSEGVTCFFACFHGLWKRPLSGLYIFSVFLVFILIFFSSILNFLVKKRATSKQSQTSAARFELPFYSFSSFLFRSAILCHSISFYFRFSFLALPLGRTSQKRKYV